MIFLTPVSGKVQNPDRYLKTLNILCELFISNKTSILCHGPEAPQKIQTTWSLFEEGFCVFNGVQFIVSVNTEVFVIVHCLHADPMDETKSHCCRWFCFRSVFSTTDLCSSLSPSLIHPTTVQTSGNIWKHLKLAGHSAGAEVSAV